MDLQSIDDEQELKAMAYDRIAMREQADRELAAINERIRQVISKRAEDKTKEEEVQ